MALNKKMKFFATCLLTGYTGVIIYWMFFGFSRFKHEEFMYNLTPLSTIKNYFYYYDHFPLSIWLINIGGNICVFIPYGILLPLVFTSLNKWVKFTITFIIGITIVEFFQLISKLGSFDVDDIILNSLGAIIGYSIFKQIKRR